MLIQKLGEFEISKNNLLIKIKIKNQNTRNNKNTRFRCDFCKIDLHRTPYSRHLKSKNHLEKYHRRK